MAETITAFWDQYGGLLLDGTLDTFVMVILSTFFAYLLGLPMGVLLNITQPHGIWPHKWLNRVLGWIINVGRSLPFIILMIAIMDFTKLLVGTKIGVKGAIVPLVVSAAPFIARMVETSLAEVDIAAINGNYALQAGFSSANDAIALEDPDSEAAQTFANIIAVKEGNENNPAVLALVEALQSDAVRDYINETYNNNVLPVF